MHDLHAQFQGSGEYYAAGLYEGRVENETIKVGS